MSKTHKTDIGACGFLVLFSLFGIYVSGESLSSNTITDSSTSNNDYLYATWTDMSGVIQTNDSDNNLMSDKLEPSKPINIIGSQGGYVRDKLYFFSGLTGDRFLNMSLFSLSLHPLDPNLIDYKINPWLIRDLTLSQKHDMQYATLSPRCYAITHVLTEGESMYLFMYGGIKIVPREMSGYAQEYSSTNSVNLLDLSSLQWRNLVEEFGVQIPNR
jgi:hypothetical protein